MMERQFLGVHSVRADEPSSAQLVMSGARAGSLRLLPHSSDTIVYSLAPLECGYLSLPKIHIRSSPYNMFLFDPNDFGSVFVYPKEKQRPLNISSAQIPVRS
jgi:hypothetical protein